MNNLIKRIRDYAHREPVLWSQYVALVISAGTASLSSYLAPEHVETITLVVYGLLSILGVGVARNKVDGPVTVADKDHILIAQEKEIHKLSGDIGTKNDIIGLKDLALQATDEKLAQALKDR